MESLAMAAIGVLLFWGVWELSGMLFRGYGGGGEHRTGFGA
jgi:hypothetical protein